MRQFVPETVVFVWDEKKERQTNIRREILKEYKQNRTSDSAPHQNNETIKSILLSMGINSIFPRQLEADDIVSYICREHKGEKVIISVDRDFLQLITPECSLYDPIRKTIFNNYNFEERTGFKDVEEWYTAKCLTGDSSDNVPGIPGFGKVTTRKYLNDPGYILTEQEHEIFTRNADIFCLDKYESLPDEKQYYKEQLAVKVESDYKQFIKFCEQFSFTRILDKKTEWHNLFFLKSLYNKLNDLTS